MSKSRGVVVVPAALVAASLWFASPSPTAHAQCVQQWMPAPATPTGAVVAACLWDPDGAGPQVERIAMIMNSRLYSWDGISLTLLSNDPIGRNVENAICAYNNELYVAGFFTTIGSVAAQGLAKWTGSVWQPVQTAPGQISALSLQPSLVVYQGELYFGGSFLTTGGAPSNYIMRYDGTTWRSLGGLSPNSPSPGSAVQALEIIGNDLYVGGENSGITGIPNSRALAKWNGTNWTGANPNLGPNTYVATIGQLAGVPWIFGAFYDPTGVALIGGTFRLNAGSWSSVPGGSVSAGPLPWISDFHEYNNKIIVGGLFVNAPGISGANDIAAHDGAAWQRMLGGIGIVAFNNSVWKMLTYRDELHVFGNFTQVNGQPQSWWARWYEGAPLLNTNPDSHVLCSTDTSVTFTAAFTGANSLQWRKNGSPMLNGPTGSGSTISGATSATLTISSPNAADLGSYDCVATNSCGSRTTNAASLSRCIADTDDGSGSGQGDCGVTIDDLLYYLFIFEAGFLSSDVDDGSGTGTLDGGVTIDDLLYFLARFEAGC